MKAKPSPMPSPEKKRKRGGRKKPKTRKKPKKPPALKARAELLIEAPHPAGPDGESIPRAAHLPRRTPRLNA